MEHKAEPIRIGPSDADYRKGIDGWIVKRCRICDRQIQRRGFFRRWTHVE